MMAKKEPVNLPIAFTMLRYYTTPAKPETVPIGWIVAGILWTAVAVLGVKGCQ